MVTLEKDFSRDRACGRCAQSLLEVISEQNVERMRGNSFCYFKTTNKKKEGGETIYKTSNKLLAVISISFSVSFVSQLTVFPCMGFRSIVLQEGSTFSKRLKPEFGTKIILEPHTAHLRSFSEQEQMPTYPPPF